MCVHVTSIVSAKRPIGWPACTFETRNFAPAPAPALIWNATSRKLTHGSSVNCTTLKRSQSCCYVAGAISLIHLAQDDSVWNLSSRTLQAQDVGPLICSEDFKKWYMKTVPCVWPYSVSTQMAPWTIKYWSSFLHSIYASYNQICTIFRWWFYQNNYNDKQTAQSCCQPPIFFTATLYFRNTVYLTIKKCLEILTLKGPQDTSD